MVVKHPSSQAVKNALDATLRKYRRASGLSQMKLADRAGIHFTHISNAERGERNVAIIIRIVSALDVPMSQFFG